jgi:hypothetical protein
VIGANDEYAAGLAYKQAQRNERIKRLHKFSFLLKFHFILNRVFEIRTISMWCHQAIKIIQRISLTAEGRHPIHFYTRKNHSPHNRKYAGQQCKTTHKK